MNSLYEELSIFFASSLDTVGLAPGFGRDWNKRAVRNRDSNHIKIKKSGKGAGSQSLGSENS